MWSPHHIPQPVLVCAHFNIYLSWSWSMVMVCVHLNLQHNPITHHRLDADGCDEVDDCSMFMRQNFCQVIWWLDFYNCDTSPPRQTYSWTTCFLPTQAVLPDCKIRNFTSDWNSGIALAALLDYCRPGLFPDWQRLRPENGLFPFVSRLNLKQHFLCRWSQQVIMCEAITAFCSNNFLPFTEQYFLPRGATNNIYIFASNAFLARNPLCF